MTDDKLQLTCADCGDTVDDMSAHDCTPTCYHCGATFDDLNDPEYDSAKIAVSRHQRECDDRPASWDEPISDPEAEFRAERRRKKRIRQWEDKQRRRKRTGQGHD